MFSQMGGVVYNKYLFRDLIEKLDKTYNFSLGPPILALASKPQLKELAKKDYPIFKDIKKCLQDIECTAMPDMKEYLASKDIDVTKCLTSLFHTQPQHLFF